MQRVQFLCIFLHFPSFIYIFIHFSAFLYISLNFSAFLYISQHFSRFLCISSYFSAFLYMSLHFSTFLCISLHFTFYILGQFGGAYRHFLLLSITAMLSSLATDMFTHVYNQHQNEMIIFTIKKPFTFIVIINWVLLQPQSIDKIQV